MVAAAADSAKAKPGVIAADRPCDAGRHERPATRAEVALGQPDLKILFTSGYSAEIAGREFALWNGEDFAQKPFPPDQLLETICPGWDN